MLTYKQFIHDLNNSLISEILFEVVGYSHYKNCRIFRKYDTLKNGNTISLIRVELTNDKSELVSFMDEFNESYKLFRIKGKGAFTLQQLWSQIKIIKIIRVK